MYRLSKILFVSTNTTNWTSLTLSRSICHSPFPSAAAGDGPRRGMRLHGTLLRSYVLLASIYGAVSFNEHRRILRLVGYVMLPILWIINIFPLHKFRFFPLCSFRFISCRLLRMPTTESFTIGILLKSLSVDKFVHLSLDKSQKSDGRRCWRQEKAKGRERKSER